MDIVAALLINDIFIVFYKSLYVFFLRFRGFCSSIYYFKDSSS